MAEPPAKHEPRLPPTGELTAKYTPVPLLAEPAPAEMATGTYAVPALGAGPPSIPGYDIVGELGRGGMGVVYKAYQVRAKRFVALKMVVPGSESDKNLLQRFHTEAQAVAHLAHPNIVQIYEMGDYNGWPYFSLEFCGGSNLGRKLGGKTVGSVADKVTGSAMSFASTYAIGHMAQKYYAGGRTLTAPDLKNLVAPLKGQASELYTRYMPEIQERAKTLDSAAILSLVRGKTAV